MVNGPSGQQTPLGNYGSLGPLSGTYEANLAPLSKSYDLTGEKIELEYLAQKLSLRSGQTAQQLVYTGALLCEGPGQQAIIAGFDWKSGDELVVSVRDLTSSRLPPHRLKCEQNEPLEGKTCLKVTLTNLANPVHKAVFWFEESTRSLIRVEEVLPSYGNSKLALTRKN